MPNTLSPAATQSVNERSTGEVWLTLIKLSQGAWVERLVNDHLPLTHGGDIYKAFSFEINLPDEVDDGVPVLSWRADNTDRRLVSALRQVTGKVTATVSWVLASQPDIIERGPMELELTAAKYNMFSVSGTLGAEPVLDRQCGYKTMTPGRTPGLF